MPKMLTVEEVAIALHLSDQTVWRYVRTGKLPANKIGRRYLIRRNPSARIADNFLEALGDRRNQRSLDQ